MGDDALKYPTLDPEFVRSQIEHLAIGVTDLSWYKGRRRLKKRLAKKVLSRAHASTVYPGSTIMAALKTVRRPQNRAARAAWKILSESEKNARRAKAAMMLAMPVGFAAIGLLEHYQNP